MEERGFCHIADMLVFALLISTAIMLLAGASPVDPRTGSTRYASSFAQSTLLSLQNSTADQFGGFEYTLNASEFGLNLSGIGGSAKRELRYKTITQLLVEDALLNLCVDAGGTDLTFLQQNQEMDDELEDFLKSALDQIIGGRFGYRLSARTEPINIGSARVYFETEIEDLTRARTQLCSESIVLSLPIPEENMIQRVEEAFGIGSIGVEPDPVIELTLELWSR